MVIIFSIYISQNVFWKIRKKMPCAFKPSLSFDSVRKFPGGCSDTLKALIHLISPRPPMVSKANSCLDAGKESLLGQQKETADSFLTCDSSSRYCWYFYGLASFVGALTKMNDAAGFVLWVPSVLPSLNSRIDGRSV